MRADLQLTLLLLVKEIPLIWKSPTLTEAADFSLASLSAI